MAGHAAVRDPVLHAARDYAINATRHDAIHSTVHNSINATVDHTVNSTRDDASHPAIDFASDTGRDVAVHRRAGSPPGGTGGDAPDAALVARRLGDAAGDDAGHSTRADAAQQMTGRVPEQER